MNNSYVIGLTGNLGSGKSTVRKMLERRGARGIDADALAHVVMERGTLTWRAIIDAFGPDILAFNGRIDRRKLGARVFSDGKRLAELEAIVHPAVGLLVKQTLREAPEPVIVVEAIKLIEAGMNLWCDATWVVLCAPQIQAERVMRDRSMTESDVNARLAAQGAVEDKLRYAHVVIENSGSEDYTLTQVVRAWSAIHPESARDKSGLLEIGPVSEVKPAAPAASAAKQTPVAPKTPPPPPLPIVPKEAPVEAKPTRTKISPPPTRPQETAAGELAPWLRAPTKARVDVQVRRARRSDLEALSHAIAKLENRAQPLTRAEALRRLGDGGFRIAVVGDRIVGLATWNAENLVATVREIWTESADLTPIALPKLLALIEEEAMALSCEVILLLIDQTASGLSDEARATGYERRDLSTLHPVWQSVVGERLQPAEQIWLKRLREEVTTRPF